MKIIRIILSVVCVILLAGCTATDPFGEDAYFGDIYSNGVLINPAGGVESDPVIKALISEQGDILYGSAINTVSSLAHGNAGDVLQSGGHGANPSWLTLGTMAGESATNYIAKALLTEQGDIIYASAAGTPAALPHGTAGWVLQSGGHGANPSWVALAGGGDMTKAVYDPDSDGILVAAQLDTGIVYKSLIVEQGDIVYGSAASTPAVLTHGTAGQILQSGGHAANPSWLNVDDTAGGTDGSIAPVTSNVVYDGLLSKIPKSLLTEQGDIIYASGVSTPAALAHGTAGQVLQSGGHGANPSWLTVDDTAGGTNDSIAPVTSNVMFDHIAAADPHTGYLLESLVDAKGDLLTATGDNTPARLAVGTVNGQQLVVDSATATGLKWVDPFRMLMTTANQTINSGAGTYVDITNLTFPVVSGTTYAFKFYIVFQSAATTTGYKASVNCPTGTLDFFCTNQTIANSSTAGVATWLQRHSVTRDDMTTLTATITLGVDLVVMIEGRYISTQNGTFAARFANELAANTDITVRAGSWGYYFINGSGAK